MITDLIEYISFRGEKLTLVWQGEEPYVALRPICERLGLSWGSQRSKLKSPESRFRSVDINTPSAGGEQLTVCLPVTKIAGWLYSIQPGRVRADIRPALISYQDECDLVLFTHVKARLLGERDAATSTLVRLQADLITRKPLWGKVERLMQAGFDFDAIWRAVKRPRHIVQEALADLLRLGFIDHLPQGTPYPQPVRPIAMDQLALFPEG